MHRIAFVVYPGYASMTLSVTTVFELANMLQTRPIYDVQFVSESGGPVGGAAFGMTLGTDPFTKRTYDTLLVGGATEIAEPSAALVDYVRSAAGRCPRVAAICSGAFILAAAGLLDGRRATTHWYYARLLQDRYPKVRVEEDAIFIDDGAIWTSAGMSAGIDLALALVEEDLGPDVARAVAQKLVLYHRRAGKQSQFSALLQMAPKSDRIQTALDFAKRNLHKPLTVADLADAAHLSPRQFSRAFQVETGKSPAKAVERLRVEAARLMMEGSRHPIEEVARQTGFVDRERMRQAFLRMFGQPPQALRRNARAAALRPEGEPPAAAAAAAPRKGSSVRAVYRHAAART